MEDDSLQELALNFDVQANCALSPVYQDTTTIKVIKTTVEDQGSLDIASYFSTADTTNCIISDFKIFSVTDKEGNEVTKHSFAVSSTGKVSYSASSFGYEEYSVFIQASNGRIFGPDEPSTVMIVTQEAQVVASAVESEEVQEIETP